MQPWAVEHGTFWALELGGELPPACAVQRGLDFGELSAADAAALAAAMGATTSALPLQRLQNGRRCFVLRDGSQIAAYGWVSCGPETVGELERTFHLQADEAYIWDCVTLPAWRGKGCYSALLCLIVARLQAEGRAARVWIGASRLNQPSVRGIANAGFRHVLDLTYRRLGRLSVLWLREDATAPRALIAAAVRILVDRHERRVGPIAIGYRQ